MHAPVLVHLIQYYATTYDELKYSHLLKTSTVDRENFAVKIISQSMVLLSIKKSQLR